MTIIDIHNHALFGIDDGAQTIADSVLMIQDAIDNGISDLILTPHLNKRSKNVDVEKHFEILKEKVKDLKINLYLGREVRYYEYEKIDYVTLNNSNYCLIEFSIQSEQPIEEICYNLKSNGFKPIIAHVERYHNLRKNDYNQLKKVAYLQLNAETVIGISSYKKDHRIAKYLLKKRLVDFVASDAHDVKKRKNQMLKAYQHVKNKYGKQYANLIFKENAQPIINN